ncbi:unnamed protein product [Periconia digitata]|uniref:Uncharacterized protein n=1 Tax=Periconia digitata TaxID=1303443 RepID=A0A9W4XLA9_9PLEO|nr:unnamed protein product [Periconia digitata]
MVSCCYAEPRALPLKVGSPWVFGMALLLGISHACVMSTCMFTANAFLENVYPFLL